MPIFFKFFRIWILGFFVSFLDMWLNCYNLFFIIFLFQHNTNYPKGIFMGFGPTKFLLIVFLALLKTRAPGAPPMACKRSLYLWTLGLSLDPPKSPELTMTKFGWFMGPYIVCACQRAYIVECTWQDIIVMTHIFPMIQKIPSSNDKASLKGQYLYGMLDSINTLK